MRKGGVLERARATLQVAIAFGPLACAPTAHSPESTPLLACGSRDNVASPHDHAVCGDLGPSATGTCLAFDGIRTGTWVSRSGLCDGTANASTCPGRNPGVLARATEADGSGEKLLDGLHPNQQYKFIVQGTTDESSCARGWLEASLADKNIRVDSSAGTNRYVCAEGVARATPDGTLSIKFKGDSQGGRIDCEPTVSVLMVPLATAD